MTPTHALPAVAAPPPLLLCSSSLAWLLLILCAGCALPISLCAPLARETPAHASNGTSRSISGRHSSTSREEERPTAHTRVHVAPTPTSTPTPAPYERLAPRQLGRSADALRGCEHRGRAVKGSCERVIGRPRLRRERCRGQHKRRIYGGACGQWERRYNRLLCRRRVRAMGGTHAC